MNTLITGKPKVLIIDDERANIQVLAAALPGMDLSFATSGPKALDLATANPPDLILLDVVMPDMDGFEILRWLKSEPRTQHVPVIFVSAMTDLETEERGFALGAVDYIVKPISPAIVRARVRTHIELKRQRDLLEEHAAMDGLTGIANRRRFDEEIARLWRAAQRSGEALTLMMIDVDHFKRYNDHYGHSLGDECLRRVAAALDRQFSRGHDLTARYGGEEFALILCGEDALAQTSRALNSVRQLEIPHAASPTSVHVTVSVGAATVVPSARASAAATIAVADEMLYAAKAAGRDRAECRNLITGEVLTVASPETLTPQEPSP